MTYRGKEYVNGEYLRSIFATGITGGRGGRENRTYKSVPRRAYYAVHLMIMPCLFLVKQFLLLSGAKGRLS